MLNRTTYVLVLPLTVSSTEGRRLSSSFDLFVGPFFVREDARAWAASFKTAVEDTQRESLSHVSLDFGVSDIRTAEPNNLSEVDIDPRRGSPLDTAEDVLHEIGGIVQRILEGSAYMHV